MAANTGFPAKYDGTCKRCGKAIVAHRHRIVLYNKPYPKCPYHLDCNNPEGLNQPTQPELELVPVPDSDTSFVPDTSSVPDTGTPSVEDAIRILIERTAPKVPSIDPESIREQVALIAKEEVARLVTPQDITINIENRTYKLEGIEPHKCFAKVLYLASKRRNIYLWGEPGWGKSKAVEEVAKAFELPYRFMTLTFQTSDTRVTGFTDGHGKYHASGFRETYQNGGVFSFDEADLANGNTISAMNNPLANGHGEFPDCQVARHADFCCFATGNTNGNGANANFPDSRPLNQAFRDRFFFLQWEEDKKFERTISLGINPQSGPWIDWIQSVRAFVKSNNLALIVSPRATYEGANYLADRILSTEEIAEGVLWRGTKVETVTRILSANPYPVLNGGAQ